MNGYRGGSDRLRARSLGGGGSDAPYVPVGEAVTQLFRRILLVAFLFIPVVALAQAEAAVSSGATSVSEIRFDLKDRAKLEREAVRLAVMDARARADAAAAGAGMTIARVLRIEEQGTLSPPPMPMMTRVAGRDAAQAADVPISSGQMEIRARVSLTAVLK